VFETGYGKLIRYFEAAFCPGYLAMNDVEKSELRRANDNPWYCLATMHGEQAMGDWDKELANNNRTAWNRWMAAALSDEQRTELVKNGFPELELTPLSPEEKSALCDAFSIRTRRENDTPPESAEHPDFAFTHFDRNAGFRGFLFEQRADFSSATFSQDADFSSATFSRDADFSSATFSRDADFSSATFSRKAQFTSATFSSLAKFVSATFSDRGFFSSATFSGVANFRAATFSKNTFFGSATFFGQAAIFRSATFCGSAFFDSVTFQGLVVFIAAAFFDRADFRSAKFSSAPKQNPTNPRAMAPIHP
jgi:hypothetical protein